MEIDSPLTTLQNKGDLFRCLCRTRNRTRWSTCRRSATSSRAGPSGRIVICIGHVKWHMSDHVRRTISMIKCLLCSSQLWIIGRYMAIKVLPGSLIQFRSFSILYGYDCQCPLNNLLAQNFAHGRTLFVYLISYPVMAIILYKNNHIKKQSCKFFLFSLLLRRGLNTY